MGCYGQARKFLKHGSSRSQNQAYKIPMLVVPSHNNPPRLRRYVGGKRREIKAFSKFLWKVTNFKLLLSPQIFA